MRKKDKLATDKITECAKQEFFEKGFEAIKKFFNV